MPLALASDDSLASYMLRLFPLQDMPLGRLLVEITHGFDLLQVPPQSVGHAYLSLHMQTPPVAVLFAPTAQCFSLRHRLFH